MGSTLRKLRKLRWFEVVLIVSASSGFTLFLFGLNPTAEADPPQDRWLAYPWAMAAGAALVAASVAVAWRLLRREEASSAR